MTKRVVVITSVMAEIRPKTKLSGLYPLVQHNFEMKNARHSADAIFEISGNTTRTSIPTVLQPRDIQKETKSQTQKCQKYE